MQEQRLEQRSALYETALSAYQAGINVIPVCIDGSKRPGLDKWKMYQQRRVTASEIRQWFHHSERGLAVITGPISGNLEALDIDSQEIYQVWLERLREHRFLHSVYERIANGYLEATPDGGRHLLYRCEAVGRNRALARRQRAEGQGYQTLIETRGNGGMLIIAPSGGGVHPSGKPYRLLHGGIARIATITAEEREQLLALACQFDETPVRIYEEREEYKRERDPNSQRPGDLFNQSARWEDILRPHGWQLARTVNNAGQWRRPGKRGPGISATTNYAGNDLLYVFSTATLFEPERGYSKFAAYTLLEHNGDFTAAAQALAASEHHRKES